ncbi:unnamed protein product, partial [Allacma fusca]
DGPTFLQNLHQDPEPVACTQDPQEDIYTSSTGTKSKSTSHISTSSKQQIRGHVFTPSQDSKRLSLTSDVDISQYIRREKSVVLLSSSTSLFQSLENISARYSSWNRLRRHTVWWTRLWNHLKRQPQLPNASSILFPSELRQAEESWIYYIQRKVYANEIEVLGRSGT